MNNKRLDNKALDTLFLEARSFNAWQDKDISDELLHELYDLMKMGPTSANSCPARVVFVKGVEAKEKLKACLNEGNIDKAMSAPVVAIIGMDMRFYERLDFLFPHTDARSWFEGNDAKISENAWRNSSLQAAYLMIAARGLGLDCGPMTGMDFEKMDQAFFAGTAVKTNMICALGYGDAAKLYPRGPRLSFDEACRIE